MLMYTCLPRLFCVGFRSGLLTRNSGQPHQGWVCVMVVQEDKTALQLTMGAGAIVAGSFAGFQSFWSICRVWDSFLCRK